MALRKGRYECATCPDGHLSGTPLYMMSFTSPSTESNKKNWVEANETKHSYTFKSRCTLHLLKLNCHLHPISSAGMAQALVRSGWMMLAALGLNHVFSPATTGELGLTTVATLKMWPFPVLALGSLVLCLTAALSVHLPVSFCLCSHLC